MRQPMERYINVNDTLREGDWESVMAAIDLACRDGCRRVKIPRYNGRTGGTVWSLTHAITLPHDFTLLLDNCYLEQAVGSYENLIANEHIYDGDYLMDPDHRVRNIKIIGEGHAVLCGGVHNHLLEKTVKHYGLPSTMQLNCLLRFWNVEGLEVRNLHLKDQRYWAVVHLAVSHAVYKNIHLEAIPHVPNMDGIDLRTGCHDFSFENITGKTGDDVIAFTALSGDGRKVPAGMDGDIHHVKIRNLKAASHRNDLVRFLNHDGHKEYAFELDTLMDSSDRNSYQPGIGVNVGSPFYYKKFPAEPGDSRDILVRNLYTRAYACMRICRVCEDTLFYNVHAFDSCRYLIDAETDGLRVKNLRFAHLYYSFNQPTYPNGETVEREKFGGCLLDLQNTSGDIRIAGLEAGPVGTGFRVSGGLRLDISGLQEEDTVRPLEKDDLSQVNFV